MALYTYQAYTKDGKRTTGVLDAPTEEAVRQQLTKMGMYPIKIAPAPGRGHTESMPFYKRIFAPKITLKDKILFTKQLAVLLKSGVPLLQALELLVDQFCSVCDQLHLWEYRKIKLIVYPSVDK